MFVEVPYTEIRLNIFLLSYMYIKKHRPKPLHYTCILAHTLKRKRKLTSKKAHQ